MRTKTLILTLCLGTPALAAETFTPPQGCTGTLTVQMRSCLVTNVWTCAADAPGEQWVSLFTQEGPWQVRKIDRDFQWLTTYYASTASVETMQQPAADPSDLDELLTTRNDLYDFVVTRDDGSAPERFVGYDRLTGESVQIDGETLLRTEFAYDVLDEGGAVTSSSAGRQFISETHRLFFFGEDWNIATPGQVTDASPMQFIYPGEAGFFSPNPKYDCGTVLSAYGPRS